MKYKKIGIHDGELKMHEKKEYSPLSFTFLETHLGKIVHNENQLRAIMEYLKENREIKVFNELKRTYNNIFVGTNIYTRVDEDYNARFR